MYRVTSYERNRCIAPAKIAKQRFYVTYDVCNTPLPSEPVRGIHVLNEGNRIEFLLAYFYDVLNGEQVNHSNDKKHQIIEVKQSTKKV